jgi:hypothetical protein
MKKTLVLILLLPLLTFAQQTAQLNFKYKSGSTIGKWQVLDLPTSLFIYSVPQGQVLTFVPACILPRKEVRDRDMAGRQRRTDEPGYYGGV